MIEPSRIDPEELIVALDPVAWDVVNKHDKYIGDGLTVPYAYALNRHEFALRVLCDIAQLPTTEEPA